jgi:hypothetical protein
MIYSPQLRIASGAGPTSERRAGRSESRSLVPAEATPAGRRPLPSRTSASFLAQLIATAQQSPQTREKRRIEPEAAILAYRAVSERA